MKNVLICVDSVFQFIIASNIRATVYKTDHVDLIIYNSYPSAEKLYTKIKDKRYFDNVYFAKTPLTYCGKQYSFQQKFPKYFIYAVSLVSPQKILHDIIKTDFKISYDHLVFNGDGALLECIFNTCLKNNRQIECYRIEDGYFSYMKEFGKEKSFGRIKFEKVMHRIFGTKNVRNYIVGYYMSEPDLAQIKFPYPRIRIPKFSRSDQKLIRFLNEAFDYDVAQNVQFRDKTIYFEDGASFFEGGDEEMEIIKEIVKFIPKDEILVKRHPRRQEDRFASMGIACCTVNGVPWEVIQLNCSMDGQRLISSCSGTIINAAIFFNDDCRRIFTYRLMRNPPFVARDMHFEKFLSTLREKYGESSIACPNTYEELASMWYG